ncbi:MAG: hypothetical protein ACK5JF_08410 [Oscillospiraceae bacterium]
MKKATHATKMRWTAAALYIVVFLLQLFLLRPLLTAGSVIITSLPIDFYGPFSLIFVTAAMAIWMFAGKKAISSGIIRAIVLGTAFILAFELITYTSQANIILIFFGSYFPSMTNSDILVYVVVIVRMMLLILAAFFVASSRDSLPAAEAFAEAEEKTVEAVVELEAAVEKVEEETKE